jgi:hypothetical protein
MKSPQVETGVNLLGRLSTDDWQEIAMANIQLGSDKEAAALGDIERVMRTDEIEGERVRVIGYAQAASDDAYELRAVEGVADVVTSLEIDLDESVPFATYTKEMAALCVRTVQNDTAMDYYFPIDRQAIAVAEILPDTSGVPRYIRKLRHYVDKTEEVVEVNDIQDTASKRELIGDLNTILSEMIYGTGVQVECKAYSQEVDATKRDIAVDGDTTVLFTDPPIFTWRGNRPVLEMFDKEDQSVLFRVDMKDVVDIIPTDEEGIADGADLFETVFTEEFQQLAWELATDLSHTDKADFPDTLREHIQTLNDALPYVGELDAVSLSGFVLTPDSADGRLKPEFIDSNRVSLGETNFVEYDGSVHAVVKAAVFDQLDGQSRNVYVIPSRDKLLWFENLDNGAEDLEFAVDELHNIAEDAGGVFEEAFYQFSLEEQLEILKQYDDEAHSVLGLIDNPHEFDGECTVMAYRCLPSDLLNVVSWSDVPLQEVGDDKGAEPFTVHADRLTVWNPELNEPPSLDGNIQNVTDLPLSFGEPMLMIGDRENDMFYLVRARDIIGLSRRTEQDVS